MSVMLNLINIIYKKTLKKEDITSWEFFQQDEYKESFWKIVDLYDTTYLRRAIPPMDEFTTGVVKHLQKQGHEIFIVTMNLPKCIPSIEGWLFVHGIDAPVIAVGRNSFAKVELPIDVLVDDSPKVIELFEKHPQKNIIVFDQPWNRNIKMFKNYSRVKTWLEVLKEVENFERENNI